MGDVPREVLEWEQELTSRVEDLPPAAGPALHVSVDGAVSIDKRGSFAGWSVVFETGEVFTDGAEGVPIHVAEIEAAALAVSRAPKGVPLVIHSDSLGLVAAMRGLRPRARGAAEAWGRLDRAIGRRGGWPVLFRWQRSHCGNALNTWADKLAVEARRYLASGRSPCAAAVDALHRVIRAHPVTPDGMMIEQSLAGRHYISRCPTLDGALKVRVDLARLMHCHTGILEAPPRGGPNVTQGTPRRAYLWEAINAIPGVSVRCALPDAFLVVAPQGSRHRIGELVIWVESEVAGALEEIRCGGVERSYTRVLR